MTSPHFGLARRGFSHGDRYERARPGYPEPAVAELCARLGIEAGTRVLDLAAGTGKLTRELVARDARVVAVEPVEGMRRALGALAGVQAMAGTAESIPLPDGAVEAVTVAQAFHWFDGPRALREIHRVLVPGGTLGLVWNVMDRSVPWVDRLQERIHRHRGNSPWYARHEWRRAFIGGLFGPLSHRAFPNAQVVELDGLLERVASVSFISVLEQPARDRVTADVAQIVADERVPGPHGTFTLPYVTDVFWCARRRPARVSGRLRP
jgi:SAM-dependent methyltransferase